MRADDWREHHRSLRQSAKVLRDAGDYRGATNRIYYSLYALVASRSDRVAPYNAEGWQNPEHSQIPGMVSQIRGLSASDKEIVRQAVKTLFKERVRADYWPWDVIAKQDCQEAFELAYTAFILLGERT